MTNMLGTACNEVMAVVAYCGTESPGCSRFLRCLALDGSDGMWPVAIKPLGKSARAPTPAVLSEPADPDA